MHCSEEVKYGLEDAFVVAHYTNATCANETLLYAEFEPNGCNGYNYSAVCEGDGEQHSGNNNPLSLSCLFALVQC